MCQGYGQQMQGKTHAHEPFKRLHCAARILRQQTVQHKRIITETQESELRGTDSLPRREKRAVGGSGGGARRGTISF